MHVRMVHLKVRRSGAISRREELYDGGEFTIGRGTDNSLQLSGLAVRSNHCVFRQSEEGLLLLPLDHGSVLVNGRAHGGGTVRSGDVLHVGSFEIRLTDPREGEDLALEVEEVQREDHSERLIANTRSGREYWLIRSRPLAWALAMTILVLFLTPALGLGSLFPGLGFVFDRLLLGWNSGPLSRAHSLYELECTVCHAIPFTPVRDQECLGCHSKIGAHPSPAGGDLAGAHFADARCADCHDEHNGSLGLARIDQGVCTTCHSNLEELGDEIRVQNVSNFGTGHPEFRVIAFAEGSDLGPPLEADLRERSGVEFNHFLHVGQLVPDPQGGKRSISCGECHAPEPGGALMTLPKFEESCRGCHQLAMDPDDPDAQAFHGDPARVRGRLVEYYSARALSGEITKEIDDEFPFLQIPGQPQNDREREELLAWVEDRAAAADEYLMGDRDPDQRAPCAECHDLRPGAATDGGTGIAPVKLRTVWLPGGRFIHASHAPFACNLCHSKTAAQDEELFVGQETPAWSRTHPYALLEAVELAKHGLEPSNRADDVNVPGIQVCRGCHLGPAEARAGFVETDCVLCHPFHRSELGLMHIPPT